MNGAGGNITPDTADGLAKIQNAISKFRKGIGWNEGGKNDLTIVKYASDVIQLYSQYKCTNSANYQNKIINVAQSYLNKGITYSKKQPHCGPSTLGYTDDVRTLDCSGYASRVYRDVELVPKNYCQNTLGITQDSTNFVKIASNTEEGKRMARVGDIIIYGQRLANGNFDLNKHSHAAIYAGNENIFEMTKGASVPKLTTGRAWDYGDSNPVYGVYRAKNYPPEIDANQANTGTIVIDPGHGTKNSRSGEASEAVFNLAVSKKIKEKLEQSGFSVYLTHNQSNGSENLGSNYDTDNQKRAEIANSKKPFLIVSIHADQPAGGAAIYYPPLDKKPDIAPESKQAAEKIWEQYKTISNFPGRKLGVKTEASTAVGSGQGGLLTKTKFAQYPIITIEMINLNSGNNNQWLTNNTSEIASKITTGIINYSLIAN